MSQYHCLLDLTVRFNLYNNSDSYRERLTKDRKLMSRDDWLLQLFYVEERGRFTLPESVESAVKDSCIFPTLESDKTKNNNNKIIRVLTLSLHMPPGPLDRKPRGWPGTGFQKISFSWIRNYCCANLRSLTLKLWFLQDKRIFPQIKAQAHSCSQTHINTENVTFPLEVLTKQKIHFNLKTTALENLDILLY